MAESADFCNELMENTNHHQKDVYLQDDVKSKFEKFIEDFITLYLRQIAEYKKRLDDGTVKEGKWAVLVGKIVDLGGVGAKAADTAMIKAPITIALHLVGKAVASVGCKINRDATKKLLNNMQLSNMNSDQVRKELITAAIEIFQSFESQFSHVTAHGTWQKAIEKLAADAVGRAINNYRTTEEKLTSAGITKGVIMGESKTYVSKSTMFPHLTGGHTVVHDTSSVKWNTAEIFTQVGVRKNGAPKTTYYTSKKSKPKKFGYRLSFNWEIDENGKLLCTDYKQSERQGEDYTYLITESDVEAMRIQFLDPKYKTKKPKEISIELIEQIKQEADDSFKELEKFIGDNFDKLLVYLDANQEWIKKWFEEASRRREAIAEENLEQHKITHGLLNTLSIKYNSVKKRVTFDIEKPLTSFVGREDAQKQIAEGLKKGIVVITGLSGMGKSELAIKYANASCDGYSVIWINASTLETMAESFHRLAKHDLDMKLKNSEGDMKSLEQIVKEIYINFDDECLFIFDSAKNFSSIESFSPVKLAPLNKKLHVLVTSQNNVDWECHRQKFYLLPLKEFTDVEAIQFVNTILGIESESQSQDILEFIRAMHNFPLALRQATAYIAEKGKDFNVSVAEFLKVHEKARGKQFKNEKHGAIFNNLEVIFTRIGDSNALKLLDVIAYIEPRQIPKTLLLKLANGSKKRFAKVTEELDRYSIIQLNKDKETCSVPGFVQIVRRSTVKDDGKEFEVLSRALKLMKNKVKNYDTIVTYLPHVLSLWRYAYTNDVLVKTFIVDAFEAKKARISYFHLIAGSGSHEVFEKVVLTIEVNFPEVFQEILTAKDGYGGEPVHYAASNPDVRVLKLLIEKHVNVNAAKRHGWTPLLLAVQSKCVDKVKVLLAAKADMESRTSYGFTALHLAVRNGCSPIVEQLLNHGADVNAKCNRGFTPLHVAVKLNNFEIVQLLLRTPYTDVNAGTEHNVTPLLFAAKAGHLECAEALLQKGANVNLVDSGHFSPLHSATCNRHVAIFKALLARDDIEVNSQTTKGNTALHMAAEKGQLQFVQALIAEKASTVVRNEEGKLAYDLAVSEGHSDVVAYLLKNAV